MFKRKVAAEKIDHERLTSLVNSMADGVLAVDEHMKVVLSNGAALNILDVNNTLKGRSLREVIHLQDKKKLPVDIEKLVARTTTPMTNRDLLLRYDDDSAINLYLSIAPVHLGYGRSGQKGYVLLLRDITHEKSLEEERDEFISVISHELRTPVAIAEGNVSNAQFISDKTGDLKQINDALEQAHQQIVFLAALINDLAMLSRAERGKLTLEPETIDVPALIKELAANYNPDAKKKGIKLEGDADGAKVLHSGPLYVREILQNFLTNALKYTEKGDIKLSAKAESGGVRFSVSDTGIGISRGDQEKLFDKFFRSEDWRTRKTTGTGLGLYVTLKLARLLQAEIDVKSQLNKGSTFSIFIPDLGE
jgi:two-component system phosphate regulon sensor histidine kinase PhoR